LAIELLTPTRAQLNLLDAPAVHQWFQAHQPEFVILAAAHVGGIAANLAAPVAFLTHNLAIQSNVLLAAHASGVQRLVWFGSSAMYPAHAPQPMPESALLSGPLDPALRPYSLAKLAGVELAHALHWEQARLVHTRTPQPDSSLSANPQPALRALCLIPPNLFGVHDRFDESATVLPSLIRRVAHARAQGLTTLSVWGTGRARRELLPASELARAAIHFLTLPDATFQVLCASAPAAAEPAATQSSSLQPNHAPHDAPPAPPSPSNPWPVLNTGAGFDLSIGELAETVCRALDYPLHLTFDASRPEGTLRKLLDSSHAASLGWRASFSLEAFIRAVYTAARASGQLP
jgi:GDP-L-fucose synthase